MHNGFIGSNLLFLLLHVVGQFYGHTGLDLVQWPIFWLLSGGSHGGTAWHQFY